jgi:hypothetical protein
MKIIRLFSIFLVVGTMMIFLLNDTSQPLVSYKAEKQKIKEMKKEPVVRIFFILYEQSFILRSLSSSTREKVAFFVLDFFPGMIKRSLFVSPLLLIIIILAFFRRVLSRDGFIILTGTVILFILLGGVLLLLDGAESTRSVFFVVGFLNTSTLISIMVGMLSIWTVACVISLRKLFYV